MTVQQPGRRPGVSPGRIATGDPDLDQRLKQFVEDLSPAEARIALETISTAIKLAGDDFARLDRKIVNSTLKELRYAFRVFAPYVGIRKVSIFGSARTARDLPEYETARDFAAEIAKEGWMVITGAGPGIMEAGHEGAGGEKSFGANIRLPMEAKPNQVIAEDEKLINFKYFFTRKLTFIKEADAFVLFPGGFGTLDEAFELLTLTQTGKTDLHPIVMLDQPGGTYWHAFDRYVRDELLLRGLISEPDVDLYRIADKPAEAVEEITQFYRVYHSQRIVDGKLVLRLNHDLSDADLNGLVSEFSPTLCSGIERVSTSKMERRDNDAPDLPRIALDLKWESAGLLRRFIDRLNELPVPRGP
jgi:uncharacterized protein (TIGR00730 family)